MLPFRLKSPKIFTVVADAFDWCITHEGMEYVFHYLDDFAVLGPPNSTECDEALHTLQKIVAESRIPLAADKQDGPTTETVFLGIVIDLVHQEL